jgi:hypothetical protein
MNKNSISEIAAGSYGNVKMLCIPSALTIVYYDLLSNYIIMHDPQKVK